MSKLDLIQVYIYTQKVILWYTGDIAYKHKVYYVTLGLEYGPHGLNYLKGQYYKNMEYIMAHQGHIIVTMGCIIPPGLYHAPHWVTLWYTGPYMMGSNNYIIQT